MIDPAEVEARAEPLLETGLYDVRFRDDAARIRRIWEPICAFLQQFVDRAGTTVDIGAGSCHYINNIASRRRIAIDINEKNLIRYADLGVETLVASASNLSMLGDGSVTSVMASNVYEHFQTREDVASSIAEVHRALAPGGTFIVLQPNFRYCMRRYYDFFDHRLAFTHEAMIEGLVAGGFEVINAYPRFLPYTTKSHVPQHPKLVALYLRIPLAWRFLGAQMLLVGRKPPVVSGRAAS